MPPIRHKTVRPRRTAVNSVYTATAALNRIAARKNNVWLVNAVVNDGFAAGWNRAPVAGLRPLPAARRMIDLQSVPGEAVLFQSDASGPQVEVEGDCHLLWAEGPYRCWRLGPGPYTLRPAQAALRP